MRLYLCDMDINHVAENCPRDQDNILYVLKVHVYVAPFKRKLIRGAPGLVIGNR